MRAKLALLGLLAVALPFCQAGLDGAWLNGASPTVLSQTSSRAMCKCAPDPLLPDPNCILCFCPMYGKLDTPGTPPIPTPKGLTNFSTCGQTGAIATTLSPITFRGPKSALAGSTKCGCAKDPFLKADEWIMCKCPGATKPRPPPHVPGTADYSAWPYPVISAGSVSNWPKCKGPYALCSFANCTLVFNGKQTSDLGSQLAECGCVTPGPGNGLTDISYVNAADILSKPLFDENTAKCFPNGFTSNSTGTISTACTKPNGSPICKAITSNTIYKKKYDFISTYTLSPQMGGFTKNCKAPKGLSFKYANCMTAACYRKTAFDGSPITCYCPVFDTTEPFLVGAPKNNTGDLCKPNPPYILSGVQM